MSTKKIQIEVPAIDGEVLQKQALESATKGALQEIKEYYEGYNSPFKKAIKEELGNKSFGDNMFKLPHIVSLLNEGMSAEIDRIVNNAIAQTYLPMVTEILTGIEKELKLSEIVNKLIRSLKYRYEGDLSIEVHKHSEYDWYNLDIRMEKSAYSITLHTNGDVPGTFQLLSMPWKREHQRTMRLHYDERKYLELPLEMSVMNDEVAILCAKLLIAGTVITIDFDGEYYLEEEYDD